MQSLPIALQTTALAGAATWPLLAGLTVVLWSRARAAQYRLAKARVRVRAR